jgi:hypothetical protein
MIKQLMYKWFGISDEPCMSCELLREQLHKSDAERKDLLHRLLDSKNPEPPSTPVEDYQPITPQFIPWRVRQQMLETEDKKKAELMRAHAQQVEKLEEELGVK